MDDEQSPQKPEPKVDLVIGLFIGIILVIADIIDFFIPLAGDVLDILVGIPVQIYAFFAGIRGTFILISNLAEAIPIVQMLPTRTIAWIITVWIDHHPKLEAVTELAGGVESGGAAGAAGEAAGAAKVAEEAAVAAKATETAAEAGEVARGAAVAAGGVGGAAEEAGAAARGAETAEEAAKGAEESAAAANKEREIAEGLGEQPEPMERLRREILENVPAAESGKEEAMTGEEEEEMEERLGAEPTPMHRVERELFAEHANGSAANKEDEDGENTDGERSPRGRVIPMPTPPRGNGKAMQDIVAKEEEQHEEWRKNRAA